MAYVQLKRIKRLFRRDANARRLWMTAFPKSDPVLETIRKTLEKIHQKEREAEGSSND